ncbi:energy transducer TonB [Phyllobacterium sp. YR531]|uniref:energy transducer TonB family protein n=1 Tax=Phyllobacterium sp. YR531 TaxID=1144343 RepID=UPI00026F49D2|nr:energy transducer TonB [Phyllobacterium sp. YR531]EJN02459.1 TonB family protein [Phyllobacterium sp. YR531]
MAGRPNSLNGGLLHPDWREVGRWAIAGVVVVGVHAGAALAIHAYQPEDEGGDIAAPIMLDMEPMPAPVVAQPVKEEPAIEPEPIEPEVAEQEAATPEAVPEPEPQIEPVEEVAEAEPEPEEVEPLEEQTEELVQLPEVEVPLPVVKPQQEKPKKPVEKKVVRKVEKPVTAKVENDKPVEEKRQAAPSAASARQAQKWSSRVQAYLVRRAKNVRSSGSKGTVTVTFIVARSGDIISARIVGSSGMGEIDEKLLSTVRNASPVPSAPDEVTVSRQSFTVPFRIQ